jgi:hypothetical protein
MAYLGPEPYPIGNVLKLDGSNGMTGNLNFVGSGQRITGLMSGTPLGSRLTFQNSVVNMPTSFGVIPNGTGDGSSINLFSGPDPDNSGFLQMLVNSASGGQIQTAANGSGTQPNGLNFATAGAVRMSIANGNTLNFPQWGMRITGEMTNTTQSNRLLFQTNVVNGATSVGAIPNGTGNGSNFIAWGSPDAANSSYAQFALNASQNATLNFAGTGTLASTPVNFNLTMAGIAKLTVNGTSGAIGLYGHTYLQPNSGNSALSYGMFFQNGSYAPNIRSDSVLPGIEFVNGNNTAIIAQIAEVSGYGSFASQTAVFGTINGAFNNYKMSIYNYGPNYGSAIYLQPKVDNAVAIVFTNAAATAVGSISTSASATTYTTTSDYRLKTNVQNLDGSLERILQCRPVSFNWISSGKPARGFIAHELQEVEPDAVTGVKDEMKDTPDGRMVPDYQGADNSFLVPDLVATVQQLIARVLALESALAAKGV